MHGHLSSGQRRPNRVVVLLGLVIVTGCGSRTATVSGKVTYNNEPVTAGYVIFYGENDRSDSGRIEANGQYTVYKAPVGEVKVAIRMPDSSRKPPPGSLSKSKNAVKRPDTENTGTMPMSKVVNLPDRYKDAEQSGLTYTVKSGSQNIDIELKP